MSKVCWKALKIESVPPNPCSPRVKFSAKVGEPFFVSSTVSAWQRTADKHEDSIAALWRRWGFLPTSSAELSES
ncbi:MAG: hypothetical protein NC095_02230 [Muribaculum sp.]|nr:hypothetical protein [Muribaculum sp.]